MPLESGRYERRESFRRRIPPAPLPPIGQSVDASSKFLPTNTRDDLGLGLRFEKEDPHGHHAAIFALDVVREDDVASEVIMQLTTEVIARVNQLALREWMDQQVEELPSSLGHKKLDFTIEVRSDYWDENHGHDIIRIFLSWATDRIRSLKVTLPFPYGGGCIELVRGGQTKIPPLPSLESLTWTGYIARSPFSRIPFGQLTTVKLLGCDLSLDDCIEVLYRCEQIVAFSNFEPEDPACALAILCPPTLRTPIIQPHTHKQYGKHQCKMPHLTSLSISFPDVTMLFNTLHFPELKELCIRVTADTPPLLDRLDINWKQLVKIVLYANLLETSSKKILAKCGGAERGTKHHHERLDGTVLYRSRINVS